MGHPTNPSVSLNSLFYAFCTVLFCNENPPEQLEPLADISQLYQLFS